MEIWAFFMQVFFEIHENPYWLAKNFVKRFLEAVVATNIPILPKGIQGKLTLTQICVGLIWVFSKGSFSW